MAQFKISKILVKVFYKMSAISNRKVLKKAKDSSIYTPLMNVSYGQNKQQVFDLYHAPKENRKHALLIDVHGGFYVGSSHKYNYPWATIFLDAGYDVALVEYRLNSKKTETKDELEDIASCLRYIFSHKEELHIEDDTKVFITGDSAGGHLALYVAEALNNDTLDLQGCHLDGVLVNCISYDYASYNQGEGMTKGMKRWMMGPHFEDSDYLAKYSPRTYIQDLSFPLFISTCANDFLRVQSLMLKQDYEALQGDITFVDIKDNSKEVQHVHNLTNIEHPASKEVNNAMISFMDNIIA